MKHTRILVFVLLGSLIGISLSFGQAATIEGKVLILKPAEAIRVDRNVIVAKGIGKPPTYTVSSTQAKLMARRAAIVIAQRNLAKVVGKVVKQSHHGVTRTRITAFIRGAKIRDVRELSNGWFEATLELPLNGQESLATTLGYDKIVVK
jgi:hypothetical protein